MIADYVLAMYDFSGKQDYIYKTNAIKEIVGGSNLIKDAYGDFLKLIQDKPLNYTVDFQKGESFDLDSFKGDCAVVYEGGGNLFMIYRTEALCQAANRLSLL